LVSRVRTQTEEKRSGVVAEFRKEKKGFDLFRKMRSLGGSTISWKGRLRWKAVRRQAGTKTAEWGQLWSMAASGDVRCGEGDRIPKGGQQKSNDKYLKRR